jgi:hypothetical protein
MQPITCLATALSALAISSVASAQQPDAPPRRAHHAVIYDEGRQRVLLTGGSTPLEGGQRFEFFNDLWEFDGIRWSPLPPSGESNRVLVWPSTGGAGGWSHSEATPARLTAAISACSRAILGMGRRGVAPHRPVSADRASPAGPGVGGGAGEPLLPHDQVVRWIERRVREAARR